MFGNENYTNFLMKLGLSGAETSYNTFKGACTGSSFLAKSPAVQTFIRNNFGILTSIISAVGIFCGYQLISKVKQSYTDNKFCQAYLNGNYEHRQKIILQALLLYPQLLKPHENSIGTEQKATTEIQRGLVKSVFLPGYSKPALEITLIGDSYKPLVLRITNMLDESPCLIRFFLPWTQKATSSGLNKLISHLDTLSATLVAPYLAWQPQPDEVKDLIIYATYAHQLSLTSNTSQRNLAINSYSLEGSQKATDGDPYDVHTPFWIGYQDDCGVATSWPRMAKTELSEETISATLNYFLRAVATRDAKWPLTGSQTMLVTIDNEPVDAVHAKIVIPGTDQTARKITLFTTTKTITHETNLSELSASKQAKVITSMAQKYAAPAEQIVFEKTDSDED
jgi:hypothetical protein